MQRISVVLPAPFGPISPSSSPPPAFRSMPSSTCRLPKRLATPRRLNPAAPSGAGGLAVSAGAVAAAARRFGPSSSGSSPRGSSRMTTMKVTPSSNCHTKGM